MVRLVVEVVPAVVFALFVVELAAAASPAGLVADGLAATVPSATRGTQAVVLFLAAAHTAASGSAGAEGALSGADVVNLDCVLSQGLGADILI